MTFLKKGTFNLFKWILHWVSLAILFHSPLLFSAIKIGLAGPFTGAYAAFGEQLWNGATLAAQQINQEGGINGQQIELIKADDACEPKQAITIANRLANYNKVNAVIGHFCSSSTIPASDVYADEQILMITPASTNPLVTQRGLKNVLRICGIDSQQGTIAAHFIKEKLKAKKLAVLHDKDTYGKGLSDAMKQEAEKLGVKIVLYEGITRGDKDFNAVITKIKQSEADCVYFGGMHGEAGPLVRQLREQENEIPFVSGDGIASQEFVISAGGPQMVRGVYMTFGADPRHLAASKAIVAAFHKEGIEPEGYTLYAYAALQVISEAMKQTKSTNGEILTVWLETHPVDTVIGKKSWDQKGDLKETDYVMYRWNSKGSYEPVYTH